MKKLVLFVILLSSLSFVNAQKGCKNQYGDTEEDSLRCLENISAFRVNYDAKNYLDAYKAWQKIITICPCSWQGVWAYSQNMFDNLIRNETDSLQRERYIDTLLWSLEVRHIYQSKRYTEGSGLGAKAFNLIRYRSSEYEKAMEMFTRSVDMEKEQTQPYIWDVYFQMAEQIAKMKSDTTLLIEVYERANEYIDLSIVASYKKYEEVLALLDNLNEAFEKERIDKMEYDKRFKRFSGDTAAEMKRVEMYRKVMANIETKFTPYAPCNVLEKVYGNKLSENKDNMVALKKIVLTMHKGGCMSSPIFIEALGIVHKAEPSAQTAYLMGNLSLANKEYEAAIAYYNEAVKLFETNEQKVDPYYMMGLTYLVMAEYGKAREAAQQAIKISPNYGKAYILIGDLYANSGARCSGGDMLPYANNWAAADKYNKAASVDPSVAAEAGEKRAKLRFPSGEDKFVRGLSEGTSFFVGCWIQESTTVR